MSYVSCVFSEPLSIEAKPLSPTGSLRLAVNPPNAVLNYLYSVLEAEAHLAAAELGLDPGLGVLHRDTPNRDSLACDLMGPIRPLVDAYLFDWLNRGPLRQDWFFEQAKGNCRLMGPFAAQLLEISSRIFRRYQKTTEPLSALWGGQSQRVPCIA